MSTVIVMLHTHGSNASSCHSLDLNLSDSEVCHFSYFIHQMILSIVQSTSSLNPLACVANGEWAEAELKCKSCLKQRGQGEE